MEGRADCECGMNSYQKQKHPKNNDMPRNRVSIKANGMVRQWKKATNAQNNHKYKETDEG